MKARHRFTEPIEVRFHKAREHLADGRRYIDNNQHATALWSIMQAILNLQRVQKKLDDTDSVL